MSRSDGPGYQATSLATERKRVLEALDGEILTGPAIFRRMLERSTTAGDAAADGIGMQPNEQSLLYPALHSLEADWTLWATWLSVAGGTEHRTYRKRRLLPRPPGWTRRG
jgi:hypothetical protein